MTPRASAIRRNVSARGMRSIAGIEELAERRAVDAGVAQEGGDAAALVTEQRLQPFAKGGGDLALVHVRTFLDANT